MHRLGPDDIAARLAGRIVLDPERGPGKRSAVAAVLRFGERGPEVLLMQRAEREGDRWSGQVSFPGGREDDVDADLRATAVRETFEEVGLDLSRARLLGRLAPVPAMPRGALAAMSVSPFVFAVDRVGELVLSAEATATFWLPLAHAASGELDGLYDFLWKEQPLQLPCWRYEERVVWGLTYQMLQALLTTLR